LGKRRSLETMHRQLPAETIIKLRGTIETLDKREQFILTKISQQVNEAKAKLKKKDQRGAMFCLKRKKMFEKEVDKLAGAKLMLEQQILALEGASINAQTFQASAESVAALRAARGNIDADRVDEVMDDINEEMELANEIGDAISRPAQEMFDDEDLLAELKDLEELGVEEELLAAPIAPKRTPAAAPAIAYPGYELPDAPDGLPIAPNGSVHLKPAPRIQGDIDDDDLEALRELAAELAI